MNRVEVLVKEVKGLDETVDAAFILQLLVIIRNHQIVKSTKE